MAFNRRGLQYLFVVGMLLGTQEAKYFTSHSKEPLSNNELSQLENSNHHGHHHDIQNLQTKSDNMLNTRSTMKVAHKVRHQSRVSADAFDYNTAQNDEYDQDKHIEEIKKFQKEFLTKQNNYQKEHVAMIDAQNEEIENQLTEQHKQERKQQEELSKRESSEKDMKVKKEEQTVTDLFKSIVHEETNKKNELEEEYFGKSTDSKKKEAEKPKTPSAPSLAHINSKQQVQHQTAKLMKGLNKIEIRKPGQSLVQASTTQAHKMSAQEEEDQYEYDAAEQANLAKFDVGVTYDDTFVQNANKPRERNFGLLEAQDGDEEDIDEDAVNQHLSYEDQADTINDEDFQMKFDGDATLLQYEDYAHDEMGPYEC